MERDRGKFRSFLLTCLKHYLANEWDRDQAQKRGGGVLWIPLDHQSPDPGFREEPFHHLTPEKAFEKKWAETLLKRTIHRLRREMRKSAKKERVKKLLVFLTEEGKKKRYIDVAAELKITENTLKVAIHGMRNRFGNILRAEIANTVDDPAKIDDEIRFLFSAIRS